MSSDEIKERSTPDLKLGSQVDQAELKKAKEVAQFLEKAFSLMKIYPQDNPSVTNSKGIFVEKIKEFLEVYSEFKVSIDEFSFSYEEEVVFQDEEKKKSLPFLFYKDGMRELSFHKGLDNEELQDFLRIIKEQSDLPPEDSDIVNAFWEKDYPHIHYFALDEFLESDIGGVEVEAGFVIDKGELSQGAINLTQDDMKEILKRKQTLGVHTDDEEKSEEGDKKHQPDSSIVSQMASMSEGEIPELEYMLSSSREPSRLAELITLLFEILYLDEKKERFSATLNVMEQCNQEAVHKADFELASAILTRMEELRNVLSDQSQEEYELLDALYHKVKGEETLNTLKKLFLNNRLLDFDSFFAYLRLLGPMTIPLIGDIWEGIKDPLVSLKASNFLHEVGKEDLETLVRVAQNGSVSLTREVIQILMEVGDKSVIPHLGNFVNQENRAIRLDTIQALGRIEDKSSNQILLKFLSDEDEEVRTVTLMNLRYLGNRDSLESVLQLAQDKDFHKKRITEKRAILSFLARTKQKEVYPLFESILKKSSFLSKLKFKETQICTVLALESMATAEAMQILSEGAELRNKILSQACKLALRKIAAKDESHRVHKGEFRV